MSKREKLKPVENGGLVIGLIVGIVIGILICFGIEKSFDLIFSSYLGQLTSAFAGLISFGSLYIAYLALREQNMMRQAGTDPVLIVHFGQREDAKEVITIDVTNVGSGTALDVELELTADLSKLDNPIFKDRLGRYPFPSIPNGKTISISFGRGFIVLEEENSPILTASVQWKTIEEKVRSETFYLDSRQMQRLDAHRSLSARQVLALENIDAGIRKSSDEGSAILAEVTRLHEAFKDWAKIR